jgi:hypothetical protein
MALRNLAVEREAKVPEGYLKAVSQIMETGLAESVQKVVTKKMEMLDRESLKLPRIIRPKESFQVTFMKAMEER